MNIYLLLSDWLTGWQPEWNLFDRFEIAKNLGRKRRRGEKKTTIKKIDADRLLFSSPTPIREKEKTTLRDQSI